MASFTFTEPSSSLELLTIINSIHNLAITSPKEQVVVFNNVEPSRSNFIFSRLQAGQGRLKVSYNSSLKEIRVLITASTIHESAAGWFLEEISHGLLSGTLPVQYLNLVRQPASPDVHAFIGRHLNSWRAPDMTLWPKAASWPSIILEVGYAESWQHLVTDRDLWSTGSGFEVNIIILVKVYPPSVDGLIKAGIEVARYSRQGLLSLVSEILLPVPQVPVNNIPLTLADIFGATLPADLPPAATVDFNIDRLRTCLNEDMIAAGFLV